MGILEIIHVGDVHLKLSPDTKSIANRINLLFAKSLFKQILKYWVSDAKKVIAIAGDLIDWKTLDGVSNDQWQKIKSQIVEVFKIIDREVFICFTPGNHDIHSKFNHRTVDRSTVIDSINSLAPKGTCPDLASYIEKFDHLNDLCQEIDKLENCNVLEYSNTLLGPNYFEGSVKIFNDPEVTIYSLNSACDSNVTPDQEFKNLYLYSNSLSKKECIGSDVNILLTHYPIHHLADEQVFNEGSLYKDLYESSHICLVGHEHLSRERNNIIGKLIINEQPAMQVAGVAGGNEKASFNILRVYNEDGKAKVVHRRIDDEAIRVEENINFKDGSLKNIIPYTNQTTLPKVSIADFFAQDSSSFDSIKFNDWFDESEDKIEFARTKILANFNQVSTTLFLYLLKIINVKDYDLVLIELSKKEMLIDNNITQKLGLTSESSALIKPITDMLYSMYKILDSNETLNDSYSYLTKNNYKEFISTLEKLIDMCFQFDFVSKDEIETDIAIFYFRLLYSSDRYITQEIYKRTNVYKQYFDQEELVIKDYNPDEHNVYKQYLYTIINQYQPDAQLYYMKK